MRLDQGSIRSSLKYGLDIDYRLAFYNGPRMIVDVLLKHGGLPHVLPLAVHLSFFSCEAQLNKCTFLSVCLSVRFKTEFLTVFPAYDIL